MIKIIKDTVPDFWSEYIKKNKKTIKKYDDLQNSELGR